MQLATETYGKDRLVALDFLRAVAAMIVAIGHTGVLYPSSSGITYSMCVAFFFILSGYVLAYAYGREITHNRLNFRNFMVLRFARLYPLHVLTAVIALILNLRESGWPNISRLGIVENVFVSQSLITHNWSLNAPAWSLGPEFQGSVLVFGLCSRNQLMRLTLLGVALAPFLIFEFHSHFLPSTTDRYWIGLGCFAFGWVAHAINERAILRVPPLAAWSAAFVAFAATIFCPARLSQYAVVEIAFYVIFVFVVLGIAKIHLQGWKERAAEILGNISYGIYLWHWLILMVAPPTSLKGLAIFSISLIAIAWTSYSLFEGAMKGFIRGKLYKQSATKPNTV